MKGAVTVTTAMMTTIFGTKVSVISCTCVSAWNRAITTPTTMAPRIAGPEAAITVQSAAWTMSSASASFILGVWSRDEVVRVDLEGCWVLCPGLADGLEGGSPLQPLEVLAEVVGHDEGQDVGL